MPRYDNISQSVAGESDIRDIFSKLSTIVAQMTDERAPDILLGVARPTDESIEGKYHRLSEQLKQELSRSAEAHSRAKDREETILNLQNQNELLRLRLANEVSGQLDSHHWEERYVALRAKLNDAEQTIAAYQEKVGRMDEYLLACQTELRDALRVSSTLDSKVQASEERANRAIAESSSLKDRLNSLRAENTTHSGKIVSLSRKLATLERVDEMVSSLEEENSALSRKLRDVTQEKLAAIDSAAKAQLSLAERLAEICALKSSLKLAEENTTERVIERVVYTEPSEQTQNIMDNLTRQNLTLNGDIAQARAEVDQLRLEREALRKRLIFFQKKTQPRPPADRELFLATQIDELKKEVYAEKKERERAQKEIFSLREEIRRTGRQLKSTEESNLRLHHANLRIKARETPNTPPKPQRQSFLEDSDDMGLEELLGATPAVLQLPNKN